MNTPDRTTRRSFIKAAAAAGACAGSLAVPRIAKSVAPKDEINVGLIGVGIRGYALHDGINQSEHARLGGISDISDHYIDRIKPRLKDAKTPIHRDYHSLLDDRNIDAVVIASPDHWHAQMTLDAMDADKDVSPWIMPMCFSDIWGPRRYDDRGHLIALPGSYMHWRCPTPAEIRWQIWETIRSACKGILFYTLAPEAPNARTESVPPPDIAKKNDKIILAKEPTDLGPNALTNPDGTATPQLEEIGKAYQLLAPHKALIRRWKRTDRLPAVRQHVVPPAEHVLDTAASTVCPAGRYGGRQAGLRLYAFRRLGRSLLTVPRRLSEDVYRRSADCLAQGIQRTRQGPDLADRRRQTARDDRRGHRSRGP